MSPKKMRIQCAAMIFTDYRIAPDSFLKATRFYQVRDHLIYIRAVIICTTLHDQMVIKSHGRHLEFLCFLACLWTMHTRGHLKGKPPPLRFHDFCHSSLLHSVCDLKATQMQHSLFQELMLYLSKMGHKTMKTMKIICCGKVESAVDDSNQTDFSYKNLYNQARWGRPKTVDSKSQRQNPASSTWRVSGKFGISQSHVVCYLHNLSKNIRNSQTIVTANRLKSQNGTLFSHVWRRGRLAFDPLQNKSCSEFFSQACKNWHITWGNNLGPDWPPLAKGSQISHYHTPTRPLNFFPLDNRRIWAYRF